MPKISYSDLAVILKIMIISHLVFLLFLFSNAKSDWKMDLAKNKDLDKDRNRDMNNMNSFCSAHINKKYGY